jgi:hypothetical protein
MSEEGLFYYFEHAGDAGSPGLGSHQMVIADHNGAFQPNAQASVRYTQPGAVMKEGSMDRWRCKLRLQTNAIELRSWDYRMLDRRKTRWGSGGGGRDCCRAGEGWRFVNDRGLDQPLLCGYRRRRDMNPIRPSPVSSRAIDSGSGTAAAPTSMLARRGQKPPVAWK